MSTINLTKKDKIITVTFHISALVFIFAILLFYSNILNEYIEIKLGLMILSGIVFMVPLLFFSKKIYIYIAPIEIAKQSYINVLLKGAVIGVIVGIILLLLIHLGEFFKQI